MRLASLLAVALAGASLSLPAAAHQIWLEARDGKVRLFFGEFGENLREESPGLLDKLEPGAKSVAAGATSAASVTKAKNGFEVGATLSPGGSIVAEDSRYPVISRKDGTKSIWVPAARLVTDTAPLQPVLDFDVVPAGPGKFTVFYKGKPLAKAKVGVTTQSGWGKEFHTDADGTFTTDMPWRGTYVIEAKHDDKTAGKRGNDAYDAASYVTSLTVMQPQGIEPIPAPPAAKPN